MSLRDGHVANLSHELGSGLRAKEKFCKIAFPLSWV
jgi:hypothetical protein